MGNPCGIDESLVTAESRKWRGGYMRVVSLGIEKFSSIATTTHSGLPR